MMGSMLKKQYVKVIIFVMIGVFSAQVCFARSSGGGDLPEFEWGEFGKQAGIAVGSMVVGGILSSTLSGAAAGATSSTGGTLGQGAVSGFNTAISNLATFDYWATGINAMAAAGQASRAVSMFGASQKWDNSAIMLTSSIASAVVGGAIAAPAATGEAFSSGFGNQLLQAGRGALIGGASAAASSGIMIAIDGDRINKGDDVTPIAQVAGFAGGLLAGSMVKSMTNPQIWSPSNDNSQTTNRTSSEGRAFSENRAELLERVNAMADQTIQNTAGKGEFFQDNNQGNTGVNQQIAEPINTNIAGQTSDQTSKDFFTKAGEALLGGVMDFQSQWPKLAANAASTFGTAAIIGTSKEDKKKNEHLESLVSGTISSFTEGILSGAQFSWGLDAKRYLSTDQAGFLGSMGKQYQDTRMSRIKDFERGKVMNNVKTRLGELKEQAIKSVGSADDPGLSTTERKERQIQQAKVFVEAYNREFVSNTEQTQKLRTTSEVLRYGPEDMVMPSDPNQNILDYTVAGVQSRINVAVTAELKRHTSFDGLDDTVGSDGTVTNRGLLSYGGMTREDMFFSSVGSHLLSDTLFTRGISGGVSAIFDRNTDIRKSPMKAIAVSGIAMAASSVARGFAFWLSSNDVNNNPENSERTQRMTSHGSTINQRRMTEETFAAVRADMEKRQKDGEDISFHESDKDRAARLAIESSMHSLESISGSPAPYEIQRSQEEKTRIQNEYHEGSDYQYSLLQPREATLPSGETVLVMHKPANQEELNAVQQRANKILANTDLTKHVRKDIETQLAEITAWYSNNGSIPAVVNNFLSNNVAARERYNYGRANFWEAMAGSIQFTSASAINNFLSFGYPTTRPEDVTTADFISYLSRLQNYGNLKGNAAWAFNYQAYQTGIGGLTNNITTGISNVHPLGKVLRALYIQPQYFSTVYSYDPMTGQNVNKGYFAVTSIPDSKTQEIYMGSKNAYMYNMRPVSPTAKFLSSSSSGDTTGRAALRPDDPLTTRH